MDEILNELKQLLSEETLQNDKIIAICLQIGMQHTLLLIDNELNNVKQWQQKLKFHESNDTLEDTNQ